MPRILKKGKKKITERHGEGIETPSCSRRTNRVGRRRRFKKFIEKLFIKASNDIRLDKGKWKGLDQKQRIVQHDNLTKKVMEFQKSGKTVGLGRSILELIHIQRL